MQNIGKIYKNIAYSQLKKAFPQLTEEAGEKFIGYNGIEQLEQLLRLKPIISSGITAIRSSLKSVHIELPQHLLYIVCYNSDPSEALASIRKTIAKKGFTADEIGEITLKAISAIHDERTRNSDENFFNTDYCSQYKFLPIELIGFQNILEDYQFIQQVLMVLGLISRNNNYYIHQAYVLAKEKFAETYVLQHPDKESMERAILCLCEEPFRLNSKVASALKQSSILLQQVAQQAIQKF